MKIIMKDRKDKAAAEPDALGIASGNVDLLIRFFESQFFNSWIAVTWVQPCYSIRTLIPLKPLSCALDRSSALPYLQLSVQKPRSRSPRLPLQQALHLAWNWRWAIPVSAHSAVCFTPWRWKFGAGHRGSVRTLIKNSNQGQYSCSTYIAWIPEYSLCWGHAERHPIAPAIATVGSYFVQHSVSIGIDFARRFLIFTCRLIGFYWPFLKIIPITFL